MPDRVPPHDASPGPDPTGATSFGGLGAGFDFFQQWMKAASSAVPGMGSAATQGATAWAMPTLDPEELEKRIQELKTVQFWLEQNARMLGVTIQTLEVQRMTLQTLKGMKVPMDALRESLRAQGSSAAAPPETETETAAEAPAAGVNPMQWWSTLTEQFSHLASQAVQAGQDAMNAAATGAAGSTAANSPEGDPPTGAQTADAPRPASPAKRPRAAAQVVPKPPAGKAPRR